MRLRQLDDIQHAIELVESGMGWDELNESMPSLSEGEKGAIFLTKAKLSEEELKEYVWLAPAALQALRTAGSFALKRGLPAARKFLKTKFGKGAALGGGAAAGDKAIDRVVGGGNNDEPDFGDGFTSGYDAAGGNRKSRFESSNSAMDKALRQIEKTFGPERKKITDQVMAMCRAAEMMTNERWKDRALSQVEQYGIKSKEELVQELQLMIRNEKAVDDEDITDTGTNIRQMERALSKLGGLSEGALAGHYRVLRRAKAEGKTKEEAHKIAKARGAHPNTVEDVYRDEIKEARSKQLHDIQWPDTDEDGDSEMSTHAYNAIRHNFPAYDAYDHVYSMSKHRDWLQANKEELINMFAGYGLPMDYDESVHEGWEELPPMPSKYVERDGLEGPIMTRSGKVVYYDPKAGDYYDPDTDMYISYDDFRMLDKKGMHMTGKVDEVAGPDKCWPGYAPGAQSGVKTKAGTGKNKGKRVNNCEPTRKKK